MKKLAVLFLSICILNLTFGCSSSKLISYDEAKTLENGKEYLILHTPRQIYELHNFELGENVLKGDLKKFKSKNGYFIHVHTNKVFDLKVNKNSSHPVELEKQFIGSIKYYQTNKRKSALIISGVVLGITLIIGVIAATSMTYKNLL